MPPLVGIVARRPVLGLVAGGLLVAGISIGVARMHAIDHSSVSPFLGRAVSVRGYVVKLERRMGNSERFRMRSIALSPSSGQFQERKMADLILVRARAGLRHAPLEIGDEVRVAGLLERVENRPGSEFDYAAYLHRAGVHGLLRADAIVATGATRGGVAGLVDEIRRNAEAGVGAGLPPSLSALARGMVLGQDERISREVSDDFKASGLAHLLAVSGQNVTLLAVLALPVLAALGLGRRGRLVAVLLMIVVYVPLTGAGPSILRAGAMGAAATVAALAGRPVSRWYALLLAMTFTLLLDPRSWLDAGWQLTFAAVMGIFVLVPRLRRRLSALPRPLAEGAAVTLAATLATYPLMAFHFSRVSLVSLLANLVALPVVAPIMWTGMLAGAVAQVWLGPAALLNAIDGFCLSYLAFIAHWTASLPNAVLSLRIGSPALLLAAYAVLVMALVGLRATSRALVTRPRGRRVTVVTVAVALSVALLLTLGSQSAPRPPDRFTIWFFAVGQGDAILLQAPNDGAVLVDGGPLGDRLIEKLRRAGVESLDAVVLTHAQADHEDGLEAVLQKLPVRLLLDGGRGSDAPMHGRIVALARAHGTPVRPGRAGETLVLGGLRLRVLSPDPESVGSPPEDPNDRAIVVLASYRGLDVLLPADAESNVTLGLPLVPAEILKVAHHGSADDGLPILLDRLKPKVAVIEVGAHNRYGHPAPETLARLEHAVPRVLRTDRDGDVRISLEGHELAIASRH